MRRLFLLQYHGRESRMPGTIRALPRERRVNVGTRAHRQEQLHRRCQQRHFVAPVLGRALESNRANDGSRWVERPRHARVFDWTHDEREGLVGGARRRLQLRHHSIDVARDRSTTVHLGRAATFINGGSTSTSVSRLQRAISSNVRTGIAIDRTAESRPRIRTWLRRRSESADGSLVTMVHASRTK